MERSIVEATEVPFRTSKPIRRFTTLCSPIFDEGLRGYGFKRTARKIERHFCSHTYLKELAPEPDHYLKVAVNTYFLDAPNYVSITLGEGSIEWPECDWNGIALWQMIEQYDPERIRKAQGDLYGLRYLEELGSVLRAAAVDLFQYGRGFLSGDLSLFRKIRAEITRSRKPYSIWVPDPKTGRYREETDEESRQLKERFSR
jgi:hypothetical protein